MGHPTRQLPHRLHLLRLAELFLQPLPFGDIAERTGHAERLSLLIPDGLSTSREPATLAALGERPILDVIRNPSFQMVAQRGEDSFPILRMQP